MFSELVWEYHYGYFNNTLGFRCLGLNRNLVFHSKLGNAGKQPVKRQQSQSQVKPPKPKPNSQEPVGLEATPQDSKRLFLRCRGHSRNQPKPKIPDGWIDVM